MAGKTEDIDVSFTCLSFAVFNPFSRRRSNFDASDNLKDSVL